MIHVLLLCILFSLLWVLFLLFRSEEAKKSGIPYVHSIETIQQIKHWFLSCTLINLQIITLHSKWALTKKLYVIFLLCVVFFHLDFLLTFIFLLYRRTNSTFAHHCLKVVFTTTGNGVQIDNHMFMRTPKKKLSSTLTHFDHSQANELWHRQTDR